MSSVATKPVAPATMSFMAGGTCTVVGDGAAYKFILGQQEVKGTVVSGIIWGLFGPQNVLPGRAPLSNSDLNIDYRGADGSTCQA